jgi:uncharacterized damage-inducible protein DinB
MHIAMFQEIFEYNNWANERLLQAITQLDEAQLHTDIHNGIGSIHTTLVHMLSGIWIWRTRWQGGMPDTMLQPDDFPNLEAICERWPTEEHLLQDFLVALQDEDLSREIRYIGTMVPGKIFVLPMWKTLVHLTNHLTQHRSEIAMKLTEWECSPGELGMNAFFNR